MKKVKKRKVVPRKAKKTGSRRLLFLAIVLVAFLVLYLLFTMKSRAAMPPVTVTAFEDSFTSQSSPTKNYGSGVALKVDIDKVAYLKFDLTSLAGQPIDNAKLRVYVTNDSNTSQTVKEVASSTWTESTITFNNQPARGPGGYATISGTILNSWKEVDVTAFVTAKAGGVATLAIDAAPGSSNNLYLGSRNSAFAPQLVIQTEESSTPTEAPMPTSAVPTNEPGISPTPISVQPTTIPTATPSPTMIPLPSGGRAVNVSTAAQLTAALADARPGDVITLADGLYVAKLKSPIPIGTTYYTASFVMTKSGTEGEPIVIQGTRSARIDGGGLGGRYGFYMITANYVHLKGFTIENGSKGLIIDRGNHNVIDGVEVKNIHDEGVHLRALSSDNIIRNSSIHDIGKNKSTGALDNHYGEGIYVGSANSSNWCTYSGCLPDASDRNQILNNTVATTGGESIDVKEGTSNGVISGNTFSRAGVAGTNADSWIDIKGNNWLVTNNQGTDSQFGPGYEIHGVLAGWGKNNTFTNNTATNVVTYGYWVQNNLWSGGGNIISCTNTATNAPSGLANVPCAN